MPKGTKVGAMFDALSKKGVEPGKAAAIAQSRTGKSLKTGKAPKAKAYTAGKKAR